MNLLEEEEPPHADGPGAGGPANGRVGGGGAAAAPAPSGPRPQQQSLALKPPQPALKPTLGRKRGFRKPRPAAVPAAPEAATVQQEQQEQHAADSSPVAEVAKRQRRRSGSTYACLLHMFQRACMHACMQELCNPRGSADGVFAACGMFDEMWRQPLPGGLADDDILQAFGKHPGADADQRSDCHSPRWPPGGTAAAISSLLRRPPPCQAPAQPSDDAGGPLRQGGGGSGGGGETHAAREPPASWWDVDMDTLADAMNEDDQPSVSAHRWQAANRQPAPPAGSLSLGGTRNSGGDMAPDAARRLPSAWQEASWPPAALADATNERRPAAAAVAVTGLQPRPPAGRKTSRGTAAQRAAFAVPRPQQPPQAADSSPTTLEVVAAVGHANGGVAAAATVVFPAPAQQLQRTVPVPDTFQSLQQYQRVWSSALTEEASLR